MLDPKLQQLVNPDSPRAQLESVVQELTRALVGPSNLDLFREAGFSVPPEDSVLDKLIQKGWIKETGK